MILLFILTHVSVGETRREGNPQQTFSLSCGRLPIKISLTGIRGFITETERGVDTEITQITGLWKEICSLLVCNASCGLKFQ